MLGDKIFKEAGALINGDRQKDYGKPQENFARIADRWEQHLGDEIEPWVVCVLMCELKLARLANGVYHHDSVVDAISYLALAAELHEERSYFER